MFTKYRSLFKILIAVHPWLYVPPLMHLVRRYEKYNGEGCELYAALILGVCQILSPYAHLHTFILTCCLIAPYYHVFATNKSNYITITAMTVGFTTSIFMWIQWGMRIAGNANFYFF